MVHGRDALVIVEADDLAALRERRAQRVESVYERPRWIAWLVFVAHLLLVLGIREAMWMPPPLPHVVSEQGVTITFAEPERVVPAVPDAVQALPVPVLVPARPAIGASAPPTTAAPPAAPRRPALDHPPATSTAPPQPAALPATTGAVPNMSAEFYPAQPVATTPATEPDIKLFNSDGSLRLSDSVLEASQLRQKNFHHPRQRIAKFMKHESPVPYTPTRWDPFWAPVNESLGGAIVRRGTVSRTFKTPWGSRIRCSWVLVIGGCGFGIAPTPLKNAPKGPEANYVELPPKDDEYYDWGE